MESTTSKSPFLDGVADSNTDTELESKNFHFIDKTSPLGNPNALDLTGICECTSGIVAIDDEALLLAEDTHSHMHSETSPEPYSLADVMFTAATSMETEITIEQASSQLNPPSATLIEVGERSTAAGLPALTIQASPPPYLADNPLGAALPHGASGEPRRRPPQPPVSHQPPPAPVSLDASSLALIAEGAGDTRGPPPPYVAEQPRDARTLSYLRPLPSEPPPPYTVSGHISTDRYWREYPASRALPPQAEAHNEERGSGCGWWKGLACCLCNPVSIVLFMIMLTVIVFG